MARFAFLILLAGTSYAQPRIVQIYRDRLRPGAEPAYTKIEENAAATCARLRCPNPYLALRSLNGPDEVWFLNFYSSDEMKKNVADAYASNQALIAELTRIAEGKKDLVQATSESFGYLQEDLSGGGPVPLEKIRYLVFTSTTFDPDHLKYTTQAASGWVFRLTPEASMVVVNVVAERPRVNDPNARVFAVVPSMSFTPGK